MAFRNFIQICFNGPMNLSKYIIFPNKSSVHIKRYVFLYRYIVLVNKWYCLSQFYPELTWFSKNFLPVSITLYVDYFASPPNVTFLAVEHKKLGISKTCYV